MNKLVFVHITELTHCKSRQDNGRKIKLYEKIYLTASQKNSMK